MLCLGPDGREPGFGKHFLFCQHPPAAVYNLFIVISRLPRPHLHTNYTNTTPPMPTETTPLLPEPSPSSPRHSRHSSWALPNLSVNTARAKRDDGAGPVHTGPSAEERKKGNKRVYALYALLVLLGVGIGVGATVFVENRPAAKPPMVPPVYKLPPVSIVVSTSVAMGCTLSLSPELLGRQDGRLVATRTHLNQRRHCPPGSVWGPGSVGSYPAHHMCHVMHVAG